MLTAKYVSNISRTVFFRETVIQNRTATVEPNQPDLNDKKRTDSNVTLINNDNINNRTDNSILKSHRSKLIKPATDDVIKPNSVVRLLYTTASKSNEN